MQNVDRCFMTKMSGKMWDGAVWRHWYDLIDSFALAGFVLAVPQRRFLQTVASDVLTPETCSSEWSPCRSCINCHNSIAAGRGHVITFSCLQYISKKVVVFEMKLMDSCITSLFTWVQTLHQESVNYLYPDLQRCIFGVRFWSGQWWPRASWYKNQIVWI